MSKAKYIEIMQKHRRDIGVELKTNNSTYFVNFKVCKENIFFADITRFSNTTKKVLREDVYTDADIFWQAIKNIANNKNLKVLANLDKNCLFFS